MDCIFCKMRDQEVPCQRIYEDDDFYAILDIRPVNLGHVLLITKKHYESILDTDEDINVKISPAIKKIAEAMKTALKCEGFNIVQNVGKAAGQEVFHSHIHIIPRFKNDEAQLSGKHKEYDSQSDMCNCARRIANVLNR